LKGRNRPNPKVGHPLLERPHIKFGARDAEWQSASEFRRVLIKLGFETAQRGLQKSNAVRVSNDRQNLVLADNHDCFVKSPYLFFRQLISNGFLILQEFVEIRRDCVDDVPVKADRRAKTPEQAPFLHGEHPQRAVGVDMSDQPAKLEGVGIGPDKNDVAHRLHVQIVRAAARYGVSTALRAESGDVNRPFVEHGAGHQIAKVGVLVRERYEWPMALNDLAAANVVFAWLVEIIAGRIVLGGQGQAVENGERLARKEVARAGSRFVEHVAPEREPKAIEQIVCVIVGAARQLRRAGMEGGGGRRVHVGI